jgi:hypothetical protein
MAEKYDIAGELREELEEKIDSGEFDKEIDESIEEMETFWDKVLRWIC